MLEVLPPARDGLGENRFNIAECRHCVGQEDSVHWLLAKLILDLSDLREEAWLLNKLNLDEHPRLFLDLEQPSQSHSIQLLSPHLEVALESASSPSFELFDERPLQSHSFALEASQGIIAVPLHVHSVSGEHHLNFIILCR